MEETQKKKRKWWLVPLGLLAVVLLVYGGGTIYFCSHFFIGTTLNGKDVSGYSAKKFQKEAEAQVAVYELSIIERDGTTEVLKGSEIGLELAWDDSVARLISKQNPFLWPAMIFTPQHHENAMLVVFDEELLANRMKQLSCNEAVRQYPSEDATISAYQAGSGYTLVPAVYGTTIDEKGLSDSLKLAINGLSEELVLAESTAYVQPKVLDDNEKLLAAIDTLNKYAQTVINYQIGENVMVLDAGTFSAWFSVSPNFEVAVEETKVQEYVKSLSDTYNTYGKPKMLMTSYGKEVKIGRSYYGWKVDEEAEKTMLLSEIPEGKAVTREINFEKKANSFEGPDYGNSYVEINLTAQHLFLYVDGEMVLESNLVSGDVHEENATPTGAFSIYSKETDRYLTGPTWRSHVDYWMPFNGGIGMHDASWRSTFGHAIYYRNGSHGCINLPRSVAKTIYGYVEKGFPVLVYNLAGTETATAKLQLAAYKVMDLIDEIEEIEEIKLSHEKQIVAARKAYEALGKNSKKYVKNLSILEEAEKKLEELKEPEEPEEPDEPEDPVDPQEPTEPEE